MLFVPPIYVTYAISRISNHCVMVCAPRLWYITSGKLGLLSMLPRFFLLLSQTQNGFLRVQQLRLTNGKYHPMCRHVGQVFDLIDTHTKVCLSGGIYSCIQRDTAT